MGLYQPTGGSIYVNGNKMTQLDNTWQDLIGGVFQDFIRYQTTIRENIIFGSIENEADINRLQKAVQNSGVEEIAVSLSNGLNTLLGRQFHDETDLSTGQWQRLAVARAYFRQGDILILDEPSSALDPNMEAEIYEQFLKLASNRTAFLVSHRLGSCRIADRIVVLNNGSLIEQGTHKELMAKNGHYAKLYEAQSEWYK